MGEVIYVPNDIIVTREEEHIIYVEAQDSPVLVVESEIEKTITQESDNGTVILVERDNPEVIEIITPGAQGAKGDKGDVGVGGGGYNFIEIVSPTVFETAAETITLTIKTMRRQGADEKTPFLSINGIEVIPLQVAGDTNVFEYSAHYALAVGENEFVIISSNGTELTKEIIVTRQGQIPTCSLSHVSWMKAGNYTITLTTDYKLISPPGLSCSLGVLSPFTGADKNWQATLTITNQNGAGTFANAVLAGEAGIGNTITAGATYNVDTGQPTIGEGRNFSRTVWHYENGQMSVSIPMGEATAGFTGQINLSAFGLSANYSLSPSGNNMIANFTPARQDVAAAYGTNIRVADPAGNQATNNGVNTNNQLQVIAYRVAQQKLTFPAYSAVSNPLSGAIVFETDANSIVSWTSGQTNTGTLVYSTDYLIDDHNKVCLNPMKWADTISANALGLLNVTVFEN